MYYYKMSALEEVDVEEQLQNQEDSQTPVIKINTVVSDENKEPKFKVGELVIDMQNFKVVDAANKEVQPIYVVKAITEDGKYLIEQHNVEEGQEISPPYEIDEDDLTPVNPPSLDFAPESKFELSSEQQQLVDKGTEEEANEQLNVITDDDDDDDDEDGDDELRKLENNMQKDYLLSYHPELKQINFNELLSLSKITRNKSGIIVDPLHKTFPYLTKFERAKILGQRAKQINNGSPIFVKVTPNIIEGHTIALMELNQKKIPFIIKRPLPNGSSEYWKVSDLNMLD